MDEKQKKTLEAEINGHPVLTMKAEKSVAYINAKRQFLEKLYRYAQAVAPKKMADMSVEFMEVGTSCLAKFDPEKSEFSHYFWGSFAPVAKKAEGKKKVDTNRGGMHLSEDMQRNLQKIVAVMERFRYEKDDPRLVEKLVLLAELTSEEAEKLVRINLQTQLQPAYAGEGDDEICLLDQVKGQKPDRDMQVALLEAIEGEFRRCQDRQKRLLSAILTLHYCDILASFDADISPYTWLDQSLYHAFMTKETRPSMKSLGELYGRKGNSVSRTLHQFEKKVAHGIVETVLS